MIRVVTVALALMALPAAAQEGAGRFTAVPNGNAVGIWVVDTETGQVKLCFAQTNSSTPGGYTAICTEPAE